MRDSKPEWASNPEELPFDLVHKPLNSVSLRLQGQLQQENRVPPLFWFILRGLLTTGHDTYLAICTLVKESSDRKFPAQAHGLVRMLFEGLANTLCLCEQPDKHSKMFWGDGYRLMALRYEREHQRYGKDSDWAGYFDAFRAQLDSWALELKLTPEQRANPKSKITHWRTPGRMLNDKPPLVEGDRATFLREVYKWWYPEESSQAHQQFLGIAMGLFARATDEHWHPGKFDSDAVADAAIFLTCITSEIDIAGNYGHCQKLRELWSYLGAYFQSARELYKLRYDKVFPK